MREHHCGLVSGSRGTGTPAHFPPPQNTHINYMYLYRLLNGQRWVPSSSDSRNVMTQIPANLRFFLKLLSPVSGG